MGVYNQDVLYIHVPKTGGWSVKNYMREVLPDVLMPDNPESRLPIGHVRLADIERFTGRSPDSFRLILAVIRNPYEQQLSQACFWGERYLAHQYNCLASYFVHGTMPEPHVHDTNTWKHVTEPKQTALRYIQWREHVSGGKFPWQPGDINMLGFASDQSCDFHVWYEQHFGYTPGDDEQTQNRRQTDVPNVVGRRLYDDYGGYYPYWLMVDGEIPANVILVSNRDVDSVLPLLLWEHSDYQSIADMPEVPRLNRSSHEHDTADYYEPYWEAANKLIQRKFAWYFAEGVRRVLDSVPA